MAEARVDNDNKYQRFLQYNFQGQQGFIEGWRKVKATVPENRVYESLVKAEVFYYSRQVEKIDLEEFKQWMKDSNKYIQMIDIPVAAEDDLESLKARGEETAAEAKADEPGSVENGPVKHPENFIELMEMIQKGMKLPDTEELNIEPMNEDPSPGQLLRPRKPWETATDVQ